MVIKDTILSRTKIGIVKSKPNKETVISHKHNDTITYIIISITLEWNRVLSELINGQQEKITTRVVTSKQKSQWSLLDSNWITRWCNKMAFKIATWKGMALGVNAESKSSFLGKKQDLDISAINMILVMIMIIRVICKFHSTN